MGTKSLQETLQTLIRQSLTTPPEVRLRSWDPRSLTASAAGAASATESQPESDADGLVSTEVWVVPLASVIAAKLPNTAIAKLRATLKDLGVQGLAVDALTEAASACATVAQAIPQPSGLSRGQVLIDAIATLTATAGKLDSVLLSATSALTADTSEVLLRDKGFTSPEELSDTQRDRWRRKSKSLTRREIAAATGWGEGEATDLVALANSPRPVLDHVHASLRSGESTWRLARSYYRSTGTLDVADAAAIATNLFGNDPTESVSERLDSTGEFHGHPWWHKEFYRALNREVTKVKARDPQATLKTRNDNMAGNDVYLNVDEYGTGCLMIGTTATQGAGMIDRVTKAAKAARAAGDPRTLKQLRVAVATALLLHGTTDVAGLPDEPGLISVEQSAELTKILHALPTAELNVIVPLNSLLGCTPDSLVPTDAEGRPLPAAFSGAGQDSPSPGLTKQDRQGTDSAGQDCPDPEPTGEDCPPADSALSGACDQSAPRRESTEAGEVGIAEVVGARGIFLTPGEARTLALTPGSTLYRLLTDPVTGGLIERSSRAYRFDGSMRAHIIAADVFCRAPGCLHPAYTGQIDHVQEYGTPGGQTRIGNGQPLDEPHHDLKTKKFWDATLHRNRDVTWTTMLGRIYTTKTHDYRQYTRLLRKAVTAVEDATTDGMSQAEAIDRQIYQALCYRPPGGTLQAPDDVFEDDSQFTSWDQVTTTHTRPDGQRSYRPDPQVSRAEYERVREVVSPAGADDDHGSGASNEKGATEGEADTPATPEADTPATPWEVSDDSEPPF